MSARAEIINVAMRQMAERGAEATSLQAIADEVGIRKPSILYHFESKEDLRNTVLEDLLARWSEVIPRLFLTSSQEGTSRFEAIMTELIDFFTADPNRARLLIRELMDRPEEMRVYIARYVQPWLELVANNVRQGQELNKNRPDVDPEAYVLTVVCMTLGSLALVDDLSGALNDQSAKNKTHARLAAEIIRMARVSLFEENQNG